MRQNICVTCGKTCMGRNQCRACYIDPRNKKQRVSIWQHEWAFLYELLDPDTDQVRYVGASEHPRIRLYFHIRNAWIGTSKKDLCVRDLITRKKKPLLKVVKKVPYQQWFEEEQRHIQSLLDAGADLLNMVVRGRKRALGEANHES